MSFKSLIVFHLLLLAFFPRFPYNTTDNQYHLQALRHLYALAVKKRELRFVDVDSGRNVHIPMQIHFKDPNLEPVNMTAPCLLRNFDNTAIEARIVSDRFYPMKIDLTKTVFGRTFYVKRRSDNTCYSTHHDPHLQRSLLVQTGNFHVGGFLDLVRSLSSSSYILTCAQYICGNVGTSSFKKKSVFGSTVEDLYECVTGDAETSLPIYLSLRNAIACIQSNSSSSSRFAWDFRLLRSYFEHHVQQQQYEEEKQEEGGGSITQKGRKMLNIEKLSYLNEVVERLLIVDDDDDDVDNRQNKHHHEFPSTTSECFYGAPLVFSQNNDNDLME